ncbi:MAG: hypothetical protein U9R08_00730 [Nanoarchaeota archaeon]|nr:hypothetical protein [Nanoarchaeota archaeon]
MTNLYHLLKKSSERELHSYEGALVGALLGFQMGTGTRDFYHSFKGNSVKEKPQHLLDFSESIAFDQTVNINSDDSLMFALNSVPLGLVHNLDTLDSLTQNLYDSNSDNPQAVTGAAAVVASIIYAKSYHNKSNSNKIIDFLVDYTKSVESYIANKTGSKDHHISTTIDGFRQSLNGSVSDVLKGLKDSKALIPIYFYLRNPFSFDIAMNYAKHYGSDDSDTVTALTGAIAGAQEGIFNFIMQTMKLDPQELKKARDLAQKLFLKHANPQFKDVSEVAN